MADPAGGHAAYDDLRAVPRHLVAEIIGGTLRTHPRPAPRHAHASARLGARLNRYFDEGDGGPGGWWILDEPELHFTSGDIVVPDIAGWRVERMPELPVTAYFDVVPDWICEVLSPSTAAEDRADKMPVYARRALRVVDRSAATHARSVRARTRPMVSPRHPSGRCRRPRGRRSRAWSSRSTRCGARHAEVESVSNGSSAIVAALHRQ